jgi:hypothetical protein
VTIDFKEPCEGMVYVPPFFAGLVLAEGAFNVTNALNLIALAILMAGVFAVARYRAALAAADASAKAWHEERDASIARADRVTEELVKATAENSALRARPDLDTLTDLVRGQGDKIDLMADRIVAAIKDSNPDFAGQRGGEL